MQIFSFFIWDMVLLPLYLFFTISVLEGPTDKIPINKSAVIRESGEGDVGHLIDEQEMSKEPLTVWEPGFKEIHKPFAAIVDLGSMYLLSKIAIYDGEGQGELQVFSGQIGQWQWQFTDNLSSYKKWKVMEVQANTRYVRILLKSSICPKEIIFFGKKLGGSIPSDSKKGMEMHSYPKFDSFIGVNAFINDPVDKMLATGCVREYHDWMWNGEYGPFNEHQILPTPLGKNYFQPSPSFPGWDFDAYYSKLQLAGLEVLVCLQNSISWLTHSQTDKPIRDGADSENPFSYLEHASFLFQYAARYGSSKVSPERLRLAPNQTKRSGMNLIKYFENWNEPDRWWNGRKGYFRPFEYAAMCSADYDGHRGKLGPDAGMKNADPNAQMAMAGLTQLDTNYIKAMKLWSDVHRNGSFPADILNFHYCPENPEGTALSPESDHMKEKFTSLLKFCEGKLPGKEVWVTEFGYDTNEGSPRKCPAISPYTREEVQAQWLVRATLEASAVSGLRHFMIYMLRNVRDDGGQQFQTCGLTSSEPTHHIPKPSWYFVSSTKKILTNSHFHKDMSVSGVRVYSYINNETGVQTLAVWSATANNTVIANFKLRFSFKVKRAIIQQLQFNKDQPVENSKEVEEGKNYLELNVSETPVFVKLYK